MNVTRGLLLNGKFYDYDPESYRRNRPLKNSSEPSEFSKAFGVGGLALESRTISLNLWNTYLVRSQQNEIGETTWLGVSRLADLKSFLSAKGLSLPIVFVSPEGISSNVIPLGEMEITIDNSTGINPNGAEFRVSLTLQDITVD